jgi:type IV pilus assembly protein PilY1
VLLSFGTGQILPQTQTSAAIPAAGTQSLFGVWDWDMSAWNAKKSTQYTSLTGTQTVDVNALTAQAATDVAYTSGDISGVRTVTQNPICWKGSTACKTDNTKFGWKLPLPGAKEQIIYNPVIADGLLLVNTTLPSVAQVLSCDAQPASGFTMAIAPDTGGAPKSSYFSDATNKYVAANGLVVSGIGISGVGTSSIVSAQGKKYLVTQTVSGAGTAKQVNPGANGNGGRLTWVKWR